MVKESLFKEIAISWAIFSRDSGEDAKGSGFSSFSSSFLWNYLYILKIDKYSSMLLSNASFLSKSSNYSFLIRAQFPL